MREPRGSRRNRLDAGRHDTVWIHVLMPTSHEPSVNQQHAHLKGTTTMFKATVTRRFIAGVIARIGEVLNTWQLDRPATRVGAETPIPSPAGAA